MNGPDFGDEDDLPPDGPGLFADGGFDDQPSQEPDDKTLSMFGDAEPTPIEATPLVPKAEASSAYLVLARKYRPQRFEDLVGQEAMVKTLTNAFATDRIAHAFMLTGVRGVGKTTTARLIARALNYQSDTVNKPSIQLDPPGSQCEAISKGNHPDVFELDAASRTGVGDMRELLDGVRYGPIAARYKVYIIDEVHMLSTSAFNALLKTLEEPPPHVKFVFATTEIRKVPITILSRCQRFDLRRIEPDRLSAHLAGICAQEGARVDQEGLDLIARAAEGSVRDGLSLLDQAIVQDQGHGVQAGQIRDMLGLADRTRTLDLMAAVLKGDGKSALGEFREQYDRGAEPSLVLRDLLDLTHEVARGEAFGADWKPAGASDHVARLKGFAGSASPAALSRLWQMLLRGFEETGRAPDPVQAAEMCLMRVCAALQLPPPEDLARLLAGQSGAATWTPPATPAPQAAVTGGNSSEHPRPQAAHPGPASGHAQNGPEPELSDGDDEEQLSGFSSFPDMIQVLEEAGEKRLAADFEGFTKLVSFRNGHLVYEPMPGTPKDLQRRAADVLTRLTGQDWIVELGSGGQDSITDQRKQAARDVLEAAKLEPEVVATLKAFPGARILEVRPAPVPDVVLAPAEEDDDTDSNVVEVDFAQRR
jgi:DNA polymerase III subunit gamma/tau